MRKIILILTVLFSGFISEAQKIGSFYSPASTTAAAAWTKPSDWEDISSPSNNEILLLVADGGVGIGFKCTVASSGTYSVDWGDGTVETGRTSTTHYEHLYTPGTGAACTRGYTTFKIRIYDASAAITKFAVSNTSYSLRNQYYQILMASFGTTGLTDMANAFYDATGQTIICDMMEYVKLPVANSVSSYSAAFQNCYNLRSFTIPSWPTVSGTLNNMFNTCYSLSSITLPTSWGSVTSTSYMFTSCYALSSIMLPTSWGSVTNVSFMFYNCNSLSSITLPTSWGSVTSTSAMFYSCYALSSITLPTSWGSVTNVSYMFYSCYALSSITLPTSIINMTSAATGVFQNCFSLKTITNFESIGSTSTQLSFADILADAQYLQQNVYTNALLSDFGAYGANNFKLKITSVRLTNQSSLFAGTSPQIKISYTNLPKDSLEVVFDLIPPALSSKTIAITGCTGTDALISKTSSGTTTGSTTITMANTSSLATGMEVYGTGVSDARAANVYATGDTVRYVAHGLVDGRKLSFTTTANGITLNTIYYVINATTDNFQISTTAGGSALDITGTAAQSFTVIPSIVTINANVSIVTDAPCTATGSVTVTAGVLKRSTAILKGWTITN